MQPISDDEYSSHGDIRSSPREDTASDMKMGKSKTEQKIKHLDSSQRMSKPPDSDLPLEPISDNEYLSDGEIRSPPREDSTSYMKMSKSKTQHFKARMSQQSAFDFNHQNPKLQLPSQKDHDETTDEKDKKILEFEKKIEEMKIAMNEKNEEIMIKDRKIRKFKKEEKQRKFKIANNVWRSSCTIRFQDWFEGFVIKSSIPYEAGVVNKHIKSFNYIYSPKLGIIKAMNHNEKTKTELGKWYIFSTNDHRKKNIYKHINTENMPTFEKVCATKIHPLRAKRNTTEVDGEVKFRIIFELDTGLLYKERKVFFEDTYLNRVHIPSEFIRLIRETIDNNNLNGEIHVRVDVKLKKRFLEKFEIDVNAAIFEVENIVEIVSDERTIYFD